MEVQGRNSLDRPVIELFIESDHIRNFVLRFIIICDSFTFRRIFDRESMITPSLDSVVGTALKVTVDHYCNKLYCNVLHCIELLISLFDYTFCTALHFYLLHNTVVHRTSL
jgi:hypothetical protein